MYRLTFKKRAAKELKKLPNPFLKKVTNEILNLVVNPRPDGSIKLKGSDENLWRIRIGDYRVIYLIDDQIRIINIRKVGSRGDVYKK